MKSYGIFFWIRLLAMVGLLVAIGYEYLGWRQARAEHQRLAARFATHFTGQAATPRTNFISTSAIPSQSISTTHTESPAEELVRLRQEAAALRAQTNNLEVLKADIRETQMALESARRVARKTARSAMPADPNALALLSAQYGDATTNLDVLDTLNERMYNGKLMTIAGNNLAGDPHFGEVKHLTLIYRIGGQLFTNAYKENSAIILPAEENAGDPAP